MPVQPASAIAAAIRLLLSHLLAGVALIGLQASVVIPIMGLFPNTKTFTEGIAVLNSIQPASNLDSVLKRIINRIIQDDGRKCAKLAEFSSEEKSRLREHLELHTEEEVDSALHCLSQVIGSCVLGVAKPPAVQSRLLESGMKEGHSLYLAQKWAENARTLMMVGRKRISAKRKVLNTIEYSVVDEMDSNARARFEFGVENLAEATEENLIFEMNHVQLRELLDVLEEIQKKVDSFKG